jgi:pimeloyl-ACP methyl ester carboxylesterase
MDLTGGYAERAPAAAFSLRAGDYEPGDGRRLEGTLPGIPVVTVDCAHFIQMEKPTEFNAILKEFLEKLP